MTLQIVAMVVVILGIAALMVRSIVREFRQAAQQDEKEKTGKHMKKLVAQWGIIVAVCIVGFVVVTQLKDGPLRGWSERLYGKPPEPIDSPFFRK